MKPLCAINLFYNRTITTRLVGWLLLCFISTVCVAEKGSNRIDSLQKALKKASKSEKISLYNKIGIEWVFNQPDSGKMYAEKSLYLNKSNQNEEEKYTSFKLLGDAYQYKSNYSLSTKYYLKALDLSLAENDKSKMGSVYNSIGMNYYYLSDFKNSKNYLWRAGQLKKESGQELHYAMVLANIVGMYSLLNQTDSAFYCANIAEKILLKNKHYMMLSILYNSIGTIYQVNKPNVDSAAYYYLKSLDLMKQIGGQEANIISTLNNLGQIYTQSKQYTLAEKYLFQALSFSEKYHRDTYRIAAYSSLTELYLAQKNYRLAFDYLNKTTVLKDSVLSFEKQKEIAKLQTQFHSILKDKKIKKQQLSIKKNELKYEKEKSKNYLIVTLSLCIIVISSALVFVFWLRKKTKETLEREKSRFFSNVVHEFRTPLTLIKGPLEEIKRRYADSETRNQTQLIENNANRLLNLVNQLLDVSKVEAGKFNLNKKIGNLSQFLENQVAFFKQIAREKNIHYTYDIEANDSNYFFSADALEKICFNLLSNAFKYTQESGIVSFTATYQPETLQIEIRDSGVGISSKELSAIFSRFYQANNGKQRGGTGIGLSLVKELIDLQNGTINVSSQVGKGSCFTVTLPLITREEPAIVSKETQEQTNHILMLVEDDYDMAYFVESVLQNEDYTLIRAKNGQEGLKKTENYIPDIIITDLMMPEMDGFEMSEKLKQQPLTQHIPIIALSAKSSQESKLEGLKTGIDTFISKPFHPDELRLVVQNILKTIESVKTKYNERIQNKELSFEEKITTQDVYLSKIIGYILENIENPEFSVEELAEKMCVSRSQLHRKITGLTGYAASAYIRLIRLEKAHELLQINAGNVSEIAYSTGFGSQPYFSKCFHEHFGYSPKDTPKKN